MIGIPDEYAIRARVAPIIVVLAPAIIFVGTSALLKPKVAVLSGLLGVALVVLLSQLGRDAGKRLEPDLWKSWGGPPAAQRLRFRGAANSHEVAELHDRVREKLGITLPTSETESSDPAAAERAYEGVVVSLRERTRDHALYPLVFAENADYGFRRNLYGLRAWGIAMALLTLVAVAIAQFAVSAPFSARLGSGGPSVAASVLALVLYKRVVTADWVRVPAEAYADRLLGSLHNL